MSQTRIRLTRARASNANEGRGSWLCFFRFVLAVVAPAKPRKNDPLAGDSNSTGLAHAESWT